MTLIIKKPTGAKLVLSKIQQYPAVLGEPWGGGYFAGYISHTADGSPTHALIVAPRATGATGSSYTLTTDLAWALNQNAGNGTNYSTTSIGATTPTAAKNYDGTANMALMEAIGISNFPAAEFCKNLSIGGFTDWYLPARSELDIAYFNLKPTTTANNTSFGTNDYAVPQRNSIWTADYPAQTALTAFNTSAEAFTAANHWSSTEATSINAWRLNFTSGGRASNGGKDSAHSVRAFRRIAL
jgi:hypothetical protein